MKWKRDWNREGLQSADREAALIKYSGPKSGEAVLLPPARSVNATEAEQRVRDVIKHLNRKLTMSANRRSLLVMDRSRVLFEILPGFQIRMLLKQFLESVNSL